MKIGQLKELAWMDNRVVRLLGATFFLCRSGLFRLAGRRYRSMSDLCQVVRISNSGLIRNWAYRSVVRTINEIKSKGRNFLVDAFLSDPVSRKIADRYSIGGAGSKDILRDIIVLKRSSLPEKGVLLFKYGQTFEAVCAIFNLEALLERYHIVLEPCWAGYCDPAILMYIQPGNPVIIQTFTEEDHRFIKDIGAPLVPVRLGPADWVNADLLRPIENEPKKYDVVMVANWAAHKRHRVLFKALREIRDRELNVLLIGFPWGGRTADDIRRESRITNNPNVSYEIVESIPQDAVARYLNQSRVFVFLSKKEGDNKALVEAMFADVPVVVYERTIGGARNRINPATGRLSSDKNLAMNICYMLDHASKFSARQWALAHTGSETATKLLETTIQQMVRELGGAYSAGLVEKVNSPNLEYKNPEARSQLVDDYAFLESCLRILA